MAIRFPGLDCGIGNRRPVGAKHPAFDIHVLALSVRGDRVSVLDWARGIRISLDVLEIKGADIESLTVRRILRKERSEDATFRSALDRRVVERVY